MNNQPEPLKKIKNLLRFHRNGLSITDIAEKLRLNRNSAAKYLEILLISGDVNLNTFGPAKVYTYSKRMPVSAMLKFSADIILLIDNEMHVLDANENAISVLGISREDLIGSLIENVKSPLIARLDIPNIFGELQEKGEIQRDFSITLQDQDYHYRMRLIPTVFDNMDEGLTIIGEDISEQIRFEERLMVSEARFRAIVEDQIDFICRFHPDGTITFINEPMRRYLGSSLEKVCGQNLLSFIVPEDHIPVRDMLQRITRSHEAQAGEIRILDSAGQYRWYQWFIRGIYDNSGALVECQSVGRDINTEREQAQKIRESEERFHMITDHSPFPITIFDREGKFLYANNAFTQLFGYSLADLPTGKDWIQMAFPDVSERRDLMRLWRRDPASLSTHDTGSCVCSITCKNGTVRQIRLFITPLQDGEQFVVYEDLTSKNEAERLHTMFATMVNSSADAPSLYRSLNNMFPPSQLRKTPSPVEAIVEIPRKW
ncbi:PAS domain-containing protein [uncultured Methanoregula sp.]|uniref:PAS domain-containing protein n=1 Tax=uncultured Methanoregula sp. TaxID=1005933 RepID=UPI002AABA5F4|nr:PAS domain-containing protein [uncultured Methanoregula sp.]